MWFGRTLLSSLAFWFALSIATAPPPSSDPFYTQPANIASYRPGQLITARKVASNIQGLLPVIPIQLKAVYQYLYRTTDSIGNPVAAVTTLLVPYNADPSKLVSYQTAYDSANNDCSPSYSFNAGANTSDELATLFLAAALDQGWYVLSPDYEGLQAQYTAGVMSGYATLDSVRVALSQSSTNGLSSNVKYVLTGYSGGSIASEWAAELQPSYAKELNISGVAVGGITPNVSSVLTTVNGGSNAGLTFAAIYGLTKAYSNLSTWFDQNIIPAKRANFSRIADGCVLQVLNNGTGQDIYSYFKDGKPSLSEPVPASVVAAGGQMGRHGVPTTPLYFYKAIGDDVSPVADTDLLYATLCSKGAVIQYQRNTFGTHATEAILGITDAMTWLSDRLNGKALSSTKCSEQNVTVTTVNTSPELPLEIISLLQDLLGISVGV